MLDLAGSIFVFLYAGSIMFTALQEARRNGVARPMLGAMSVWFGLQVAVVVAGRNLPRQVPPNGLMFALSVLLLGIVWWTVPRLRKVAIETPLESLIALHIWRLGGFFFLMLYASGRAGWPFAPVAAIGDIITGAAAACLIWGVASAPAFSARTVRIWNMFGLLDLLVAVALALLSTPKAPAQLFRAVPQQTAFAELPWIVIPAAIVPALMFAHIAIGSQLRGARDQYRFPITKGVSR